MKITLFANSNVPHGSLSSESWEKICSMKHRKVKKDSFMWAFKTYQNNYRKGIPDKFTAVVLDIDNKDTIPPTTWEDIATEIEDYKFFAYSTHSDNPLTPKWRLIVPLPEGYYFTAAAYPTAYDELVYALGTPAGLDKGLRNDLSKAVYMPATFSEEEEHCWVRYNTKGEYFPFTTPSVENGVDKESPGGRNDTLKEQATAAYHKGKTIEQTAKELEEYDAIHHDPPLFDDPTESNYRKGNTPYERAVAFTKSNFKNKGAPNNLPHILPVPTTPPPPLPDLTFPSSLFASAPGIVGRVARWIYDNAIMQQEAYALGAALSLVSILKSHRYYMHPNIHTNLLIINIGRTSTGKDWPFTAIQILAKAIGCDWMIKGRPASGAGLLDGIYNNKGKMLCQWDELGAGLEVIANSNANSWQKDIMDNILTIWSHCGRTLHGRLKSSVGEQKFTPDIVNPHLSVLGASTPSQFYSALSSKHIASGFLPRWLFFAAPNNIPRRNKEHDWMPPDDLVEELREILEQGEEGVVPVNFTPEAGDLIDYKEEEIRKIREAEQGDPTLVDSMGKMIENIKRIAVTIAGNNNTINISSAEWCCAVVQHCMEGVLHQIRQEMYENEYEKNLKKVLSIIRESGINGISKFNISKKTQPFGKTLRNAILEDLCESERITVKQEHQKRTYFFVQ